MLVQEMTEKECLEVLKQTRFGRLACARDNQPYVVPVYFACDGTYLYGFSTPGRKIEWMRTNPLVCLEVDEVTDQSRWKSVVVFGRYEELPDTAEWELERKSAYELLQQRVMWWQPAYVAMTHRESQHPFAPVFYRVHINKVTGHRATPDRDEVAEPVSTELPARRQGRLRSLLRQTGLIRGHCQ